MKTEDIYAHGMYLGTITKFSSKEMIQAVSFDGKMHWFNYSFSAKWWLRANFAQSNVDFVHITTIDRDWETA